MIENRPMFNCDQPPDTRHRDHHRRASRSTIPSSPRPTRSIEIVRPPHAAGGRQTTSVENYRDALGSAASSVSSASASSGCCSTRRSWRSRSPLARSSSPSCRPLRSSSSASRCSMLFFWMIFITLMLPVEVRILPTYKVIVDLGLIDTYTGLTLPLMASATATFLFRQFFLTIPGELVEAARIDNAGPFRFMQRYPAAALDEPTSRRSSSSSSSTAGPSISGRCSSPMTRA